MNEKLVCWSIHYKYFMRKFKIINYIRVFSHLVRVPGDHTNVHTIWYDSLTFSYQNLADQHHGAKIQKHAFRFWQRYTTQKKLKYSKLQFKSNNCGLFTDHCSLPPIFNYWITVHIVFLNAYRHERQALATRRAQQQTSQAVFERGRALTLAAQSRRATGARVAELHRLRVLRAVFAEWRTGTEGRLFRGLSPRCLSIWFDNCSFMMR